jgi:hypothetical protein
MSERPYFTCPGGVWLRDPALNGCQEDSIALFKIICEASNRDWRIEVSPVSHAFSVRQCIKDPNRFRRWSEERINRCLAELRARGCLLLATAHDREWIEVPDRLCYCKGHKPEAALGPPVQVPLALADEATLFALPDIGMRVEKKKSTAPESARELRKEAARESRTDGNRARSSGKESEERFARPIEDITATDLGKRLVRFIGPTQMVEEARKSGARWLQIIVERADEMENLLDQGERCRSEMPNGKTRAKFLTLRLHQRHTA